MGTCGCPTGTTNCGGACTSLTSDANNCGACGNACSTGGAGITCQSGACTCPTGMVYIPGGAVTMGATDLNAMSAHGDTYPHPVTLSPNCIDQTEVRVTDYAMCPSGTCSTPGTTTNCNWGPTDTACHPINCVTWMQAQAYYEWVHGGGGNLPTEAQWEFAAGGSADADMDAGVTGDLEYPWGTTPLPNDSLLCWNGGSESNSGTRAVGSYPIGHSPWGLYDMAGNVWEWTRDCYAPYVAAAVTDPDIEPGPTCTYRVKHGGSWGNSDAISFRAAYRDYYDPSMADNGVGCRCALGH